MYSNQVDRLRTEIASLRSKLADERKRLADANSKTLKALEALQKATPSQFSSRSRDVERHQKAAAALEKKAADLEKVIAQKEKNLTSASASLDRAQRDQRKKDDREAERQRKAQADQQKKDDREADKRRKADLDHVRTLERERRATIELPQQLHARPRPNVSPTSDSTAFTDTYDVCLSFAGEQRAYVELVATGLKHAGLNVFYDQDEDIAPKLWGRDLGEYLDYIYRRGSRFCLMFISAEYAQKSWTRHERRSALARAIEDGSDYVLPARFDSTDLPGLRPTIGYVDLQQTAPQTLVDFVLKKLGE